MKRLKKELQRQIAFILVVAMMITGVPVYGAVSYSNEVSDSGEKVVSDAITSLDEKDEEDIDDVEEDILSEEWNATLSDLKEAIPGVDYSEDELVMFAKSREEAEMAAAEYTKSMGVYVYVERYNCEVATLKIDPSVDVSSEEAIDAFTDEVEDGEYVVAMVSLAASPDYDLPEVYPNYKYSTNSVGSTVIVNTKNENEGGINDFTDPFLGGNPDTEDEFSNVHTPSGVGNEDSYNNPNNPVYYQWYHELVNDKFVWREMSELKNQGDQYKGVLNPDFNENLSNMTVAVIDTGFNSLGEENDWYGSEAVVSGNSFITYDVYEKKETEEVTETDEEAEPLFSFSDQNGFVDEIEQYDGGHGTNVASIIGSPANDKGGRGVAAGAKVMPLKVFGVSILSDEDENYADKYNDGIYMQLLKANTNGVEGVTDEVVSAYKDKKISIDSNSGKDSTIFEALNWAIYHSDAYYKENGGVYPENTEINGEDVSGKPLSNENVRIVNMSLGSAYSSVAWIRQLKKTNNYNITAVCSAGNDGGYTRNYPGDYDGTIGVASLNADYGLSTFTNRGSAVTIAAPGGEMMPHASTFDNYYEQYLYTEGPMRYVETSEGMELRNSISSMHGTSQASPVVAGVCALICAQYPQISNEELKELIVSSAKTIKTCSPYVTKCIDAAAALGIDHNVNDRISMSIRVKEEGIDKSEWPVVYPTEVSGTNTYLVLEDEEGNNHATFYYTVDGSNPVISDECKYSGTQTMVTEAGLIPVTRLISCAKNKSSFTVKVKMLLYGLESNTQSITIKIADNEEILNIFCNDTYRELYDDGQSYYKISPGQSIKFSAFSGINSKLTNNVYWTVSDETRFSVTNKGVVTAKEGSEDPDNRNTYTLTATIKDNPLAQCSVYLNPVYATEKITFTPDSEADSNYLYIDYNDPACAKYSLSASLNVIPKGASDVFLYESDNSDVISVDDAGVLTVNDMGTAIVTVSTTDNSGVIKKIKVVVGNGDECEITAPSKIYSGQTVALKAQLKSDPEGDKNLEWFVLPEGDGVNEYGSENGENTPEGVPQVSDYFTLDASTGVISVNKDIEYVASFTIGVRESGTTETLNSTTIKVFPKITSLGYNSGFAAKKGGKIYVYAGMSAKSYNVWFDVDQVITKVPYNSDSNYDIIISNPKVAALKVNGTTANGIVLLSRGTTTITVKTLDGSNKSISLELVATDSLVTVLSVEEKNDRYIIYPGVKLQYFVVGDNESKRISDVHYSFETNESIEAVISENVNISDKGVLTTTKEYAEWSKTLTDENRGMYVTASANSAYNGTTEELENKVAVYMFSSAVKSIIPIASDSYLSEKDDKLDKYEVIPKNGVEINGIGNSKYLFAKVNEGAYGDEFIYKSSNTNVCTVLSSGRIIAKGLGTATITITAADGSGKNAKVKVKVTNPVSTVTITRPSATKGYDSPDTDIIPVAYGKQIKFGAFVDNNSTNKKYNWKLYYCKIEDDAIVPDFDNEIKDAKVAKISNGRVVVGKTPDESFSGGSLGENYPRYCVAVVAESEGVNKYGKTVYCSETIALYPATTGITTSTNKIVIHNKNVNTDENTGDENQVVVTVSSVNSDNYVGSYIDSAYEIKVANSKIVSVQNEGSGKYIITGLKKGSTTVNFRAIDGSGKNTTVKVTVDEPVNALGIMGNVNYVKAGKKLKLMAYASNKTASNKKVVWNIAKVVKADKTVVTDSSEIEKYATINKSGLLSTSANTEKAEVYVTVTTTDRKNADNNISSAEYKIVIN